MGDESCCTPLSCGVPLQEGWCALCLDSICRLCECDGGLSHTAAEIKLAEVSQYLPKMTLLVGCEGGVVCSASSSPYRGEEREDGSAILCVNCECGKDVF